MTEVTTDFAISYLLDDCQDCPENKDGECMTQSHCFEVKQMAIKALRQECVVSTQKHVGNALDMRCDDLISRQAVEEIINDIRDCISVEGYWAILERLKKLPSVNPHETVTEFADRCRECGAKYGKLLKQEPKTRQFAEWVAREIFDDMWEYNKDAFAEIACRKLEKLGIVRAKGDEWELVEPQESEEISDTNLKMWEEIFKAESEDKR